METPDASNPIFQFLGPTITAIILGAWGAINYMKSSHKPGEGRDPRDQFGLYGAAFGDSQALEKVRDELREMRAIIKDGAANTIKTNELMVRTNELLQGICEGVTTDLPEAIRGLKFPARRRGPQ